MDPLPRAVAVVAVAGSLKQRADAAAAGGSGAAAAADFTGYEQPTGTTTAMKCRAWSRAVPQSRP
jgi:hypothetical protein